MNNLQAAGLPIVGSQEMMISSRVTHSTVASAPHARNSADGPRLVRRIDSGNPQRLSSHECRGSGDDQPTRAVKRDIGNVGHHRLRHRERRDVLRCISRY